ncbi:SPOR domain-containing protein [Vogesella oryzae]|uniref:SPOR domain-containing protein n=1 Tax=Vogesella oryzae TaxID=1735285 RepID=UPI001FE2B20F|nr:SPOR domain-containing protein [Vogesella oryzae]
MRKRLAIAGGLVAVALAAIPVLESFNSGDKKPPASSSTPVSSGRIVNKNDTSAPALVIAQLPESSAPQAASTPAIAAPQAADSITPPDGNSPAAPQPGSPQSVTPAPKHSTPLAAAIAQAKPAAIPQTPPYKPLPQPADTASKTAAVATQLPTTAPPARSESVATVPGKAVPLPPPARLPALTPHTQTSLGYQLQLGLFASPSNAEKLVSDLKKHGLTARTETRVQLGPFRTRAEAEEAMQRLRELGYQPLLVPLAAQ